MSIEESLLKCEKVLGEDEDDPEFERRTLETCRPRLEVLTRFVEDLCLEAKDARGSKDAFRVVSLVEAALSGIDVLNKMLKPVGLQLSPDAAKDLADDRKGAFKTLTLQIGCNIHHAEPVQGVVVPILRHVVAALSEFNASINA